MSNIHGISGYRNRQGNNGEGSFRGQRGEIPNFLNAFVKTNANEPNPRYETFGYMLKNTFCPNITMRSFVSIISLVDLACFIATVLISLIFY